MMLLAIYPKGWLCNFARGRLRLVEDEDLTLTRDEVEAYVAMTFLERKYIHGQKCGCWPMGYYVNYQCKRTAGHSGPCVHYEVAAGLIYSRLFWVPGGYGKIHYHIIKADAE
jgi:hypothetical protein